MTEQLGRLNLDHSYILLETNSNDNTDQHSLLIWMNVIFDNIYNQGILLPIVTEFSDDPLIFYKRCVNNKCYYICGLSRDLTFEEVSTISKQFSSKYTSGDFKIKWSQIPQIDFKLVSLQDNVVKGIALTTARSNHNSTVENQLRNGWRFGKTYDPIKKVSPLCTSWDNLHDSYKSLEFKRILSLLTTLDNMNLQLISK